MFKWIRSVKTAFNSDKWQRIAEAVSVGFSRTSSAGKSVNVESLLQLSAAWACIRLTAQAISSLPINIFERASDGSKHERHDSREAMILRDSPNADQTGLEFWESIIAWELATGNSYAEIIRIGPNLSALVPMASPMVTPFRTSTGDLKYRVINDNGQQRELERSQVLQLKFFDVGKDLGLSPIRYGANSFGASMAADESAAKLFSNGIMSQFLLKTDKTLKEEQREQFRTMLQQFAGSDKAFKTMVLEAGLSAEKISLNPEDAQLLETRRFNIEDICRWFGVPPIIVGHAMQGQTMWGSGVEQILNAWLALGLNPMMRKIEARVKKQLFLGTKLHLEFNREGLLQLDSKAKAEFLSKMTQNGLMTRNEGRSKINMPAVKGGDELTVQTNLTPLSKLGVKP